MDKSKIIMESGFNKKESKMCPYNFSFKTNMRRISKNKLARKTLLKKKKAKTRKIGKEKIIELDFWKFFVFF
jgi:hypothetical protein